MPTVVEDRTRMTAGSGIRRRQEIAACRRGLLAAAVGLLLPVMVSCSRRAEMAPRPTPAIPRTALEHLRTARIFFGHQSVGKNIIAGMEELLREQSGAVPRIAETADPAEMSAAPLIAHAKIGENTRPLTKIDDFVRIVSDGVGAQADAAFFKFCYIDLVAGADPDALFARYREALLPLQSQFPATRFVHLTMPLRVVQSGPRAWVKKIIGRPIGGYADNIVRNRFNTLMREAYGKQQGELFDLARLESTGPAGARCTFAAGGTTYEALCPEHTTDGGHLARGARRAVARELLMHLASLPRRGA